MATRIALKRLENLIWTLIYGGLLSLVLGLVTRDVTAVVGHTLVVGGAIVAAVGAVLIFVRARLREGG